MGPYSSENKPRVSSKKIDRAKHEDENGDRFIAPREIKPMLSNALGHLPKLPVCKNFCATHAAGVAIAGLAVSVAKTQTMVLYDFTDIWCGELYMEPYFTDDKVLEHATLLNLLLKMMSCFGMQEKPMGGNVLNEIIRRLPRRSLKHYWDNTTHIWKTLNEIRGDIHRFALNKKELSTKERSEQIRLLLEKVAPRLRETRARFKQMKECLDAVTEDIRADWDKDLDEISRGCLGEIP